MKVGVTFLLEKKLAPYLNAVRAAGLEAEPISPGQRRGLEGLHGLVLTGGGDIDPTVYGSEPHGLTTNICRERDDLEQQLIEDAARRDLPVLGICRGLQILNVGRGGTLKQHIEGHQNVEHAVQLQDGSRVATFIGSEKYTVNSRHHQAIDRLGTGLVVTGVACDGIIEAVEDPARRFLVAVQWHPEDRPSTPDSFIFQAFAKAVFE